MKIRVISLFMICGILIFAAGDAQIRREVFQMKRADMVRQQISSRGISDKAVLAAMGKVPRHLFVPENLRDRAYGDHPLPIGYGQTISQPYIVALMTQYLEPGPKSKILEIGTGSGYQAAVLAEITPYVYSVEIVKELHERSANTFRKAGYTTVKTRHSDGYYGWKEHAPYDGIIVTAAAEFVPPPLISQLKTGGIMCIPVGPPFSLQQLIVIRKKSTSAVESEVKDLVRFVPLTRERE